MSRFLFLPTDLKFRFFCSFSEKCTKTAGDYSKIINCKWPCEELINTFPRRHMQILELIKLLGPLNSPMIPLFVYIGASTGKQERFLRYSSTWIACPFIYSSCITCYNPRILFESILNQLLLHRKQESNVYSSAKCGVKPSDFVNLLHKVSSTVTWRILTPRSQSIHISHSPWKRHFTFLLNLHSKQGKDQEEWHYWEAWILGVFRCLLGICLFTAFLLSRNPATLDASPIWLEIW